MSATVNISKHNKDKKIYYNEVVFENGSDFNPKDTQLKKLLSSLKETEEEDEQKKYIKKIVDVYKSSKEQKVKNLEARNIVLEFFTKYGSKDEFNEYLQEIIGNDKELAFLVKTVTDEILEKFNETNCCDIKQCYDLISLIYFVKANENFDYSAAIEYLFPVYYLVYEGLVYQSTSNFVAVASFSKKFSTFIYAVLTEILSCLEKTTPFTETISTDYSVKLIVLSHAIITNETVPYCMKAMSGLIKLSTFKIIPEDCQKQLKYKECPLLEFLKDYNDEECFTIMDYKLPIFTQCDSIAAIYHSILGSVSQGQFLEIEINDKPLVLLLYEGVLKCAKGSPSPPVAIHISKILSILVRFLTICPIKFVTVLFLDGISYAWAYMERPITTVQDYAKEFFAQLVMVALYFRDNGFEDLSKLLKVFFGGLSPTDVITFPALECIIKHSDAHYVIDNFEGFQEILLRNISDSAISDDMCSVYIYGMKKHSQELNREKWYAFWIEPMKDFLKRCPGCSTTCENLLVNAALLSPFIIKTLYPENYVGTIHESLVLLKCLQEVRLRGINLYEVEETVYWRGIIHKSTLTSFALHQKEEIRIALLAAILESESACTTFVDFEFEIILSHYQYNATCQKLEVRKQIISYYKKFLNRCANVRGAMVVKMEILKQDKAEKNREQNLRTIKYYEQTTALYKTYIWTFARQLVAYLSIDSNYYRRASTLELLVAIKNFLQPEEWQSCWSEYFIINCHNMLFDKFESIKKMALCLIKSLPLRAIGLSDSKFTLTYMQRSIDLVLHPDTRKNLTASYLLEVCTFSSYFYDIMECPKKNADAQLEMIVYLLERLHEEEIKIDLTDNQKAFYGLLSCIRRIIEKRKVSSTSETYSGVFKRLVAICMDLVEGIMPFICQPPERINLPKVDVLVDTNKAEKTQRVVCYVKEITLLLAELVKQTEALPNSIKDKWLTEGILLKIGDSFLQILTETRQVEVIEAAYEGFCTLCKSFWKSPNPNINSIPTSWLVDALAFCTGDGEKGKVFSVKYMEGASCIYLGVLSTEIDAKKPSLHMIMDILLGTAENDKPSQKKYKLCSMVMLVKIFRSCPLGQVSNYVAKAMMIVMKGFQDNCSKVRSCSIQLYSSLMVNIFGIQQMGDTTDLPTNPKLTKDALFQRYPELYQFFLDLLKSECPKYQVKRSQFLQQILLVLAKLYPPITEEHLGKVEEYLPHIITALGNPFFKIRDLAAKTSISLIPTNKILDHIICCFSEIKHPDIEENRCQGLLLQIKHILNFNSHIVIPLERCIPGTIHLLKYAGRKFSHMTVSLYMEILLNLLMEYREYNDLDLLKDIMKHLSKQLISNLDPLTARGRFTQYMMLLSLFITINKFETCEVTYPTVTNLIMSHLYGHNQGMKKFCLDILIYLNQMWNDEFTNHALYKVGEFKIPEEIKLVVDSWERDWIKDILTHIHPYVKSFLLQEIRYPNYIRDEEQVYLFLLANYYPCVLLNFTTNEQETLRTLARMCFDDNDELASAVISCISTYILHVDEWVLIYRMMVKALTVSASPAAAVYRRLAVAELLMDNHTLYRKQFPIMNHLDLQDVFYILMTLLEDDEQIVRNTASDFAMEYKIMRTNTDVKQTLSINGVAIVAEKARQQLLHWATILPRDRVIAFMFQWACRHFPDSDETCVSFNREEINLYAENVPYFDLCVCILSKQMWCLEEDLNYEDKSIFIEEQTLLATTMLLDSITKYGKPIMLEKTKTSVVCALKSIIRFIENYPIETNFLKDFKKYLEEKIFDYFTKQVEHSDLRNVKTVFRKMYDFDYNLTTLRNVPHFC